MGASIRPPCSPCRRICTLVEFTQPERGYLWQLIMPAFMHINESASSLSPFGPQQGETIPAKTGNRSQAECRRGAERFLIVFQC